MLWRPSSPIFIYDMTDTWVGGLLYSVHFTHSAERFVLHQKLFAIRHVSAVPFK